MRAPVGIDVVSLEDEEDSVGASASNDSALQAPASLRATAGIDVACFENEEEPQDQASVDVSAGTDATPQALASHGTPLAIESGAPEAMEELVEDDGDDLFLNSCVRCGETWLLPLDFGEEFDCMDAGKPCGPQAAQAALASFELDFRGGPGGVAAPEGRPPPALVRSQLLCQILAKSLGAFEAADLMTRHGFEPPREGELTALEAELRAKRTERARALRAQARSTEGDHRKKAQRYLEGKLVDVAKGTKFLVEPKETAEQRAKTSVSISIVGSRSKPIHDAKKKGPVS